MVSFLGEAAAVQGNCELGDRHLAQFCCSPCSLLSLLGTGAMTLPPLEGYYEIEASSHMLRKELRIVPGTMSYYFLILFTSAKELRLLKL